MLRFVFLCEWKMCANIKSPIFAQINVAGDGDLNINIEDNAHVRMYGTAAKRQRRKQLYLKK